MDENGKVVVDAQYDAVNDFNHNMAVVMKNKVYSIIDPSGKQPEGLKKYINGYSYYPAKRDSANAGILTFDMNELNTGYPGNHYLIKDETTGEEYYVRSSKNKNCKYFLVKTKDETAARDEFGIKNDGSRHFAVLKREITYYNLLIPIGGGLAKYKMDVTYGIADMNGNVLFKPKFDEIYYTDEDIFKVHYHNQICYLKKTGEWIWKPVD